MLIFEFYCLRTSLWKPFQSSFHLGFNKLNSDCCWPIQYYYKKLLVTHLENKDSYVRMLFIDFSSAFNTIIPQQLLNKLNLLGLNNSLCNWILDFLTGRPQSVRVGHNTSSTTTLSTGAPQGCVLSPLLFTLLTHDCTAKFSSNHIKFADDTTVVGLISNNDETHYREEVAQLAEWCGTNNLSLNVGKTKEVVMD